MAHGRLPLWRCASCRKSYRPPLPACDSDRPTQGR
ncbi:hypothetical protein [Sphingomonas sp. BE137]